MAQARRPGAPTAFVGESSCRSRRRGWWKASVGKTVASAAVAALMGVDAVVHVDDLSQLVRVTMAHPIDGADDPWDRPASDLTSDLVTWTRHLHAPIKTAVGDLLDAGGVIEGEGVDPRLRLGRSDRVQAVYVIEEDRERLRLTFESRPSRERFLVLTERERQSVVELNYRYGQWLKEAAAAAGEPWVPSQPWDSLPSRILDACS